MRKAIFALKCTILGLIDEIIFNTSNQIKILRGQKFIELFDEASYEKAQAFFLQSKKTDEASYSEYELSVPTNDDFCLLYFKSLAVDDYYLIIAEEEESDYYQLFGSLTSINNELILTQKTLNKKNKELLEVNELKNRLVGVAAHDLRNPISVIYTYSEMLMEDCVDEINEENFEFLESINSTSKFMLSLVEDLLDLSHLESGKVTLKSDLIDFKEMFAENYRFATTLAAKKDIKMFAETPQTEILIKADKNKIQQVISNFISNAIKYSHAHSKIVLACQTSNNEVVFSCKDTGYGIDKEDYDKIFEPFQQAKSSQYIQEQSTGLGLAISKQIIAAHKGKIWLDSEVNKGSTFYFSLPLETQNEKVKEKPTISRLFNFITG